MIKDCTQLIYDGVITGCEDNQWPVTGPFLDIRIGSSVWTPQQTKQGVIDPTLSIDVSLTLGRTKRIPSLGYLLKPGKRCIVWSREKFSMPNNLSGLIMLRSRCAQAGLDHAFSGGIKPGWSGRLALELINSNPGDAIMIKASAKLAQVCFFRLVN